MIPGRRVVFHNFQFGRKGKRLVLHVTHIRPIGPDATLRGGQGDVQISVLQEESVEPPSRAALNSLEHGMFLAEVTT